MHISTIPSSIPVQIQELTSNKDLKLYICTYIKFYYKFYPSIPKAKKLFILCYWALHALLAYFSDVNPFPVKKCERQLILTNTLSFFSIHKTLAINLVLYKSGFPRTFCYPLVAKKQNQMLHVK